MTETGTHAGECNRKPRFDSVIDDHSFPCCASNAPHIFWLIYYACNITSL